MLSGTEETIGSEEVFGADEDTEDNSDVTDGTDPEDPRDAALCTMGSDMATETGETASEEAGNDKDDVFDTGTQEQPAENIARNNAVINAGILFCPIIFFLKEKAYSANSICCSL